MTYCNMCRTLTNGHPRTVAICDDHDNHPCDVRDHVIQAVDFILQLRRADEAAVRRATGHVQGHEIGSGQDLVDNPGKGEQPRGAAGDRAGITLSAT